MQKSVALALCGAEVAAESVRNLGGLALLVALTVSPPAFPLDAPPPGPGWQEAQHDSELVVYFRDDPARDARELRATTEMDVPPRVVFGVVTDFEHYPAFMPYTKDVRIISWKTPTVLLEYSLLTAPFVSARDSVNEVRLTVGTRENSGVYRTDWSSRPDLLAEQPSVVRVRLNTGSWVIEPIGGGRRSRVTYSILTSPGGAIPRFLADRSNTAFVAALFKAVRARASVAR